MFVFFQHLVALFCRYIRAFVFDHAFPLPRVICLRTGPKGTFKYFITTRVIEQTVGDVAIFEDDDENAGYTLVTSEGEIRGCFTICRYLGRHWKLYPSDPFTAAYVDFALEDLQELITSDDAGYWKIAVHNLEENYIMQSSNMFDMDVPSLADICWSATFDCLAARETHLFCLPDPEENPFWGAWWSVHRNKS